MSRDAAAASADWIILRTAGRCTLPLVTSLKEDGFDAWAPSYVKTYTVPRANVKRRVTLPLLAGIVFVRAVHLIDMLELAAMPVQPRRGAGLRQAGHSRFAIFHDRERIPTVRDAALDELRVSEKRAVPAKDRPVLPKGSKASVPDGIFGGVHGEVLRSNGNTTDLQLGNFRLKIETFLLNPNGANGGQA
jgi:hypothetical protein